MAAIRIRMCTALMATVLSGVVLAQDLVLPGLSPEPVSMLGDRIRMQLPEGTLIEPRYIEQFMRESCVEDETKATLALGGVRLRFEAQMLFQTAGDDFEDSLAKLLEQDKELYSAASTELIRNESDSRLYLTTLKPSPAKSACACLHSAWVIHPDHLVEVVHGYVMDAAPSEYENYRTLIADSLKTIKPGPARLNIGPRTVRFSGIELTLPDGYGVTSYLGPDFLVHRVQRVVPLGQPVPSLGVYDGSFPNMFHGDSGVTTVESYRARLFGKKVKWFRFRDGDSFCAEALFEFSKKSGGRELHIFCTAPSKERLDEMLSIAAALQFIDDKSTNK